MMPGIVEIYDTDSIETVCTILMAAGYHLELASPWSEFLETDGARLYLSFYAPES